MIEGTKVKVLSTASGNDQRYANREGVVVRFDPSLPWTSPRALLAPEMFVCVHFLPLTKKERKHGSPMDFIDHNNLVAVA